MGLFRQLLLKGSQSRWLARQIAERRFTKRTAARFMPGESAEDALEAADRLSQKGIRSVLTYLGENVTEPGEAREVSDHYVDVLDRVRDRSVDAELSVKLTQLGLDIGTEVAERHLTRIVEHAAELSNFVWIDMEGSSYREPTLDLFRNLRSRYPNVGVCLQAYLHRTPEDLASLLPLSPAIRLVKGAYMEPAEIAHQRLEDVNTAYLNLATELLSRAREADGARPAFGTHDLEMVRSIRARAEDAGLAPDAFEIQMLYGIQRAAQERLAAEGVRVRVLISYGTAWFPWFMRRLAERPANTLFLLRNLFRR